MPILDDLKPIVSKQGTYFYAAYRVPWGKRIVMKDGRAEPFDTEFQAFKAATYACFAEFRNKTDGWLESAEHQFAKNKAEALFRPKKVKGS